MSRKIAALFVSFITLAGCSSVRGPYVTGITGQLSSTDPSQSKAAHDQVAVGLQKTSQSQGDVGHQAMVGSGLLGTSAQAFWAVDQWTNKANMTTFYNDPALASGFATLLSGPPTVEQYQLSDWHTWGALEDGQAYPTYYWVRIRGHLASTDTQASQKIHDGVASTTEKASRDAGDIAHLVFLGLNDPQDFLAIDVWKTSNGLEQFYANPNLQAAFGQLFDGAPSVTVMKSTDWHQW